MSTVAAKAVLKHPPRDAFREVIETIVFVVALVLMLKLFVVEAFVIPTGSMAETLLGYNKVTTCPDCGYEFPVNSSNEVDPQSGPPRQVSGATCPNCRYRFPMTQAGNPGNRSGDRVLVHKALYSIGPPARGDVVVFKFPVDPQIKHTAQNYIKRLWGLGEDTIAIHNGDLYLARGLEYPVDARDSFGELKFPRPEDPLHQWEGKYVYDSSKTDPRYRPIGPDYTYHNADVALAAFEASHSAGFPGGPGKFELIRKPDPLAISMRRIVYNNEHQSKFLSDKGVPARWQIADAGWKSDVPATPRKFTHSGDGLGWVRYSHRLSAPPDFNANGQPADDWVKSAALRYQDGLFPASPIMNFLGYNAGIERAAGDPDGFAPRETGMYWVGDLMLECTATVTGPADEVVLELSKGVSRFQARFTGGKVTLVRTGPAGKELASAATPITGAGTHELRFANFDCRLRVWVDEKVIDFGPAADYSPSEGAGFEAAVGGLAGGFAAPQADGHTITNDVLAPASVGAKGNAEIGQLVLWQDTFFTPDRNDPAEKVDTYFVQPGHYLCLGDNSGQSSDGRTWGLVPERLMLGRAVFIFWPFPRIGFIR